MSAPQERRVIKKNLGSPKRTIFTVPSPENFSPAKSRASLTGNFVALEKLNRLMIVPVLHQHGLRELQRLPSSGISRKEGLSHFPGLGQFSPVTQTLGLTGDFVALEELHRPVFVRVLHQGGLGELQPPRSSEISENIGSSQFRGL